MAFVELLTLLLLLKVSSAVHICTNVDNLNGILKGKLLYGSIIINTTTGGLLTCSKTCLLRRRCKSFNFKNETGECHLNSKTRDSATKQLRNHDDFVFSDISSWPETLIVECANYTCPLNSFCDYLNNSQHICKTTGCLGYPDINHGHLHKTHAPEESSIGTVLSYTCDEEYMPKDEVVCQSDGTWFSDVCVGIPSCSMWKQLHPDSEDGEYWLRLTNFENIRARIYCHKMSTPTPREYLTLRYPNHGIYPLVSNYQCTRDSKPVANCKGKGGDIWFNKIRVNIRSMKVYLHDRIFATYSHNGNKLRYGVAEDCYTHHVHNALRCGTRGKFTVNLMGTGWRIRNDQEWKVFGWQSMIEKVDRQLNGTFVVLKCGGYKGGCKPKDGLFLKPVSWVGDQ